MLTTRSTHFPRSGGPELGPQEGDGHSPSGSVCTTSYGRAYGDAAHDRSRTEGITEPGPTPTESTLGSPLGRP